MPSPSLESIETLQNYEEIFNFVAHSVKTVCDFDGITLAIHQKDDENFFLLTEDLQWREMTMLPQSLIKTAFESKIPHIITEPRENSSFNIAIDCASEERTSALLLYPIDDENTPIEIVLSLWKTFHEEKHQIIEPLIVGSQQIGSTTRVKKTLVQNFFHDEDIESISHLKELIYQGALKLLEHIEIQKETVRNQIKNDQEVFNSPQEIIATLINILMGVNTSVNNIQDILEQLQKQTHPIDKTMPNIVLLKEIVESLNHNLVNTFSFTSNNNVIQELFKPKESISTEDFFSYFSSFKKELVCKKGLIFNFFLDPRLAIQIEIAKQSTYLFLNELLEFAFKDSDKKQDFDILVLRQTSSTCLFIIRYHKATQQQSDYLNLFSESENSTGLHLSYKKFIQAGGKVSVNSESDTGNVTFKLTIPYHSTDPHPLSSSLKNTDITVGLLLDKTQDIERANNLARYMIALGLEKTKIKGANNLALLKNDITHLIVFQSQFSDILFEETLKDKPYHIMILSDSCAVREQLDFYDFSAIDVEVDAANYYLDDLKDYLSLEEY